MVGYGLIVFTPIVLQTGGTFTVFLSLFSVIYLLVVFCLHFFVYRRTRNHWWTLLTFVLCIPIFFVLFFVNAFGVGHMGFYMSSVNLSLIIWLPIREWLTKRFPDKLTQFEEELRRK